jgi:hypothetical protein
LLSTNRPDQTHTYRPAPRHTHSTGFLMHKHTRDTNGQCRHPLPLCCLRTRAERGTARTEAPSEIVTNDCDAMRWIMTGNRTDGGDIASAAAPEHNRQNKPKQRDRERTDAHPPQQTNKQNRRRTSSQKPRTRADTHADSRSARDSSRGCAGTASGRPRPARECGVLLR